MAITRTAMEDDDGSGTTGTIFNNAWKQELYNQIDAAIAPLGGTSWTEIPFTAGNFGAPTGSWTVTSSTYAYMKISETWVLTLSVYASTVAGTPAQLTLWNPLGVGSYGSVGAAKFQIGTGGWETGAVHCYDGGQALAVTRPTLLPFPAGSTIVFLTIIIPKV